MNACSNSIPALRGGVPYHPLLVGYGYQPARTGSAYVVMFYFNVINNYFQVKLIDSLKANKYYYAEYYVNLTNISEIACNNQSMLFTKNAVYVDTANNAQILPANPQITNYKNDIIADTVNWVKVSGIFKAQGGEQYLTLGNFRDLVNDTKRIIFQTIGYGGALYYADDVGVYELDSFCLKADAGKDTAITLGDSVFIGSYTNGIDSLKWQIQNTTIDSTRPGFWVKPTTTTTYILQQTVNGCFSADTVVVTVGTVPLKFLSYALRQAQGDNPSSLQGTKQSVESIWTTANEVNVSYFNIQSSLNGKDFITVGKVIANNKSYNEYSFADPLGNLEFGIGTLYYRIQAVDFDGRKNYSTTQQITIKPQTTNKVFVYPNPATNVVNLVSKDIKQITITDITGRIALQQNGNNAEKQIVNIEALKTGVYMLHIIKTDGSNTIQKLVKQ